MTSSLLDRSHYPCLRDSVYLNQASLGLIGQPSVAAMHSFLENVARHGNLYMSDSEEINYGHALRGVAGRLFHNDPSRIAILAGASELLGQFPLLFRLRPNATILAVSSDFPAITRPWVRQSYFEKIRVRFVDDLPNRDLTEDDSAGRAGSDGLSRIEAAMPGHHGARAWSLGWSPRLPALMKRATPT